MATTKITRALTKTQLDYAISRLDAAYAARLTKLTSGIAVPQAPAALTNLQKYTLIKEGKAKLQPFSDHRHEYFYSAFSYPEQEKKMATYTIAKTAYDKKVQDVEKPLKAAYRSAMDTLVMGSAEAALAVVEAFAAGK